MQRIMIIGQPGSGKSTLARMLGTRLGLPTIHMDRHVFWLPGWEERPKAEQLRIMTEIVAQEAWVFEGSNSSTFHIRGARADTLIWLDVPLPLRLFRVIRRNILGLGQTRPDMGEACPEKFTMLPGFMWYILRTGWRNKRKCQAFFDDFDRPKHRLTTLAEVNAFVETAR